MLRWLSVLVFTIALSGCLHRAAPPAAVPAPSVPAAQADHWTVAPLPPIGKPKPPTSSPRIILGSLQTRFFYTAGASGTYTVPTGAFVTGLAAHASAGGATLTMTPSGPDVTAAAAGPAIPIPIGGIFLGKPVLEAYQDELGDGSVLVFTGTDSYFVTLLQYGSNP